MGIRPKFDLNGENNGLEQDSRTGSRGKKQAGFDVHTIFNTKTRHPLTREGQLI